MLVIYIKCSLFASLGHAARALPTVAKELGGSTLRVRFAGGKALQIIKIKELNALAKYIQKIRLFLVVSVEL